MTVHVEFLEGLGDDSTSPGVLTQAAEARKLPGVTAAVRRWYQWPVAAAALKALPAGVKRVVVGYSNGGSEVTQVADEGFPIDLLIAEDPTIWLAMASLHSNVAEAICFENINPFSSFPPVGHANLSTAPDFHGVLKVIATRDMHINVDTDPTIQATVLAAIKELAS